MEDLANASMMFYHNEQQAHIYIHPLKCNKCDKYFNDIPDQLITSINHEIQEGAVMSILRVEKGYYKNEWFDKTVAKNDGKLFYHRCGGDITTLHNSGYFR